MSNCDCLCHDGTRQSKRGNLARTVENRMQNQRVQDAARTEIERYYTHQKAMDATMNTTLKDDIKRRDREAKERNGEMQMLSSLYEGERQRELALIKAEEEERLATALQKRTQDKDRKDKELQRLKEQSSELRELAEKIRIARMNKERSLQLQEKAQINQQQQEYDAAFNTYVQQSEQAAMAKEAEFQARRREQNVQARHVLEEQMQERQDMLRQAEAEHARERAMVDEIVRRIAEEDMAEATLKRSKQDETKAYIARFLQEQDLAKQRRVEEGVAEDRKIQDHWQMVREREAQEAERKALRKEVADRMYEKVKREMEEENRRREEEENLINMLRMEELEAKRRGEEEDKKRKAEEMRREMQRANEYQMRLKEERELQMKAEEEDFRRRMMAKFAEDDRIEQLNAAKRRMKVAEHQREVQRMVEEKRRMYEEQKAREEAERAALRADEDRRAGIVEGERRRMLQEAAELVEFMPRGVLRDQQDLELVRQTLAQKASLGRR